jgi:hypothetical protein
VLISLLKSVGFEWNSKMQVSSANKIGTDLSFTNLGKSFISMRTSKGPFGIHVSKKKKALLFHFKG